MDGSGWAVEHPKKRRRRNQPRQPRPARLILKEHVPGGVGVLSDDLWEDLCHAQMTFDGNSTDRKASGIAATRYIAISPPAPATPSQEEIAWTIIPARRQNQNEPIDHSTIHLPATSSGGRRFLKTLELLEPVRNASDFHKPLEIRALDVRPISLDTVFITVEKNLLNNVDQVQSRFGGGFQISGTNGTSAARKNTPASSDSMIPNNSSVNSKSRLTCVVREGLSELGIVHTGEVFSLPLPFHPITHVPPPPAVIAYCEPVAQGILSAETKIILIQAGSSQAKALKNPKPTRPPVQELIEDESEDTSNEQFYSAAEDRQSEGPSEIDGFSGEDDSETEQSSQTYSDDASDDSLDDVISLSAPGLAPQQPSTKSTVTSATPRSAVGKATGALTPGSVYSNFTARTARPETRSGKMLSTETLLQRISIGALHPRPHEEDDDDSFVFVDISTLAKVGCFSGDWVRLETVKDPIFNPILSLSLSGFQGSDEGFHDWRPVRVFGLPGLSTRKPRYAVNRSRNSSGISQTQSHTLTQSIFIPPVLMSNLGDPHFVRLALISKPSELAASRIVGEKIKSAASLYPPTAKEITLLKLSTPTATSRDMQSVLLAGLKKHFEFKKRLLKAGDLVAIPIDEELGKATFSPVKSNESGLGNEELINRIFSSSENTTARFAVAWFCVDQLGVDFAAASGADNIEEPWGGVAVMDSSSTRMAQAGTIIRKVPQVAEQNWRYWMGQRRVPVSQALTSFPSTSASKTPTPPISPTEKRLSDLMMTATSPRAINMGLPPLFILLHSTQRQTGKSYTARSASAMAGLHFFPISAHDVLSEGASPQGGGDHQTEALLKARTERAIACGPEFTAILIQHIEVLTADRIVPTLQEILADARVIVATTTEIDKISDGIRGLFTHELEIKAPNEAERESILQSACLEQSMRLDPSVSLKSVALKTAALVAGDLVDVVDRVSVARSLRLQNLSAVKSVILSDIFISGGTYTTNVLTEDFTTATSYARSTFSDSIGAPKIPSVTWKDVGGLADQKSSIMETISLPLARPELFAKGMRKRSGILFYGPPGTGKTLLAKAIATEFSLNFFSVKGPELLNMYIGESEANVRRVFQKARDARPCVVFFDELDSVAPKRGNQGDSGGVMDRIVSQLLAELDGMSSSSGGSGDEIEEDAGGNAGGVFVIGATNRPDLLDPALLRPGRFDKMLYLGVSSTHEQQVTILEALTRKFSLAPDVDLSRVAERLPFTYTGADLYALCSDAMLKAITRKTAFIDEKVREASRVRKETISTAYFFDHLAKPEDIDVVVREEDFAAAQRELVASVSAKELAHFERIRDQFEQQDMSQSPLPTIGMTKPRSPSRLNPIRPSQKSIPIRRVPDHGPTQPPPPPAHLQSFSGRKPEASDVVTNVATFKGKGIANPDSGPDSGEEDDDYIIRTSHLNGSSLNGENGNAQQDDGFIDGEDDDDLYD